MEEAAKEFVVLEEQEREKEEKERRQREKLSSVDVSYTSLQYINILLCPQLVCVHVYVSIRAMN